MDMECIIDVLSAGRVTRPWVKGRQHLHDERFRELHDRVLSVCAFAVTNAIAYIYEV